MNKQEKKRSVALQSNLDFADYWARVVWRQKGPVWLADGTRLDPFTTGYAERQAWFWAMDALNA